MDAAPGLAGLGTGYSPSLPWASVVVGRLQLLAERGVAVRAGAGGEHIGGGRQGRETESSRTTPASLRRRQSASGSSPAASFPAASVATPRDRTRPARGPVPCSTTAAPATGTGPSRDCGNRKHLRVERMEEQIWGFVRGLLRDPERIRAGLDRLDRRGEDERRPGPGAERSVLVEEDNRGRDGAARLPPAGRQGAHGRRRAGGGALGGGRGPRCRPARSRGSAGQGRGVPQALERDSDALLRSYAGAVVEVLDDLAPEERHRVYKLLRLGVRPAPTGSWRSRASSRRWARRGRGICRPANARRLAYKGFVYVRGAEDHG